MEENHNKLPEESAFFKIGTNIGIAVNAFLNTMSRRYSPIITEQDIEDKSFQEIIESIKEQNNKMDMKSLRDDNKALMLYIRAIVMTLKEYKMWNTEDFKKKLNMNTKSLLEEENTAIIEIDINKDGPAENKPSENIPSQKIIDLKS